MFITLIRKPEEVSPTIIYYQFYLMYVDIIKQGHDEIKTISVLFVVRWIFQTSSPLPHRNSSNMHRLNNTSSLWTRIFKNSNMFFSTFSDKCKRYDNSLTSYIAGQLCSP